MSLLIKNLNVHVQEKKVLRNVSLEVPFGELTVLAGSNGSGKSSLAHTLVGDPGYRVLSGSVELGNKDLLAQKPWERVLNGLFLCFQNPPVVEGLSWFEFLKESYNAFHKTKDPNFREIKTIEFRDKVKKMMSRVGLGEDFLERNLNEGFSGGEKKKSELVQMLLLKPKLVILDEVDSGLDLDSLKKVIDLIAWLLEKETGILLITHHPRILEQVSPDQVAIMESGKIIERGGGELVKKVLEKGFENKKK